MINNFSQDFGPFEGRLWLNCAHQGPLPRVAASAAEEAIAWKRAPWNLTTERFSGVPQRLKQALGQADQRARRRDHSGQQRLLWAASAGERHPLAGGR